MASNNLKQKYSNCQLSRVQPLIQVPVSDTNINIVIITCSTADLKSILGGQGLYSIRTPNPKEVTIFATIRRCIVTCTSPAEENF